MNLTEKHKELEKQIEINYSMISKYIDKEIYLENYELIFDYIEEGYISACYIHKFLPGGNFITIDMRDNTKYEHDLDDIYVLRDKIEIVEFLNKLLKDKLNKILNYNE